MKRGMQKCLSSEQGVKLALKILNDYYARAASDISVWNGDVKAATKVREIENPPTGPRRVSLSVPQRPRHTSSSLVQLFRCS